MTKMIPVFALLALAACGNPAKKACNNAADCAEEAGAELDVDQCVADAETAEEEADELGCSSEYKDAMKCSASAECDAETGIVTGCEAEGLALFECAAGGGSEES